MRLSHTHHRTTRLLLRLGLCLFVASVSVQTAHQHRADAQEKTKDQPKKPSKITLLGPSKGGNRPAPEAPDGLACSVDELKVYKAATEARVMAEAREAAETLLDQDDDSYVAHFVLGYVHHYGEGNLPRSSYHFEKARNLFQDKHGKRAPESVRLWHANMLVEHGRTFSDLGKSQEAIDLYLEHDRLYPDLLPEKISTVWPLMKMRRFNEAIKVAHSVLKNPTTGTNDRAVALNGYVAVLFEKGLRDEAHKWALQLTTEFPDSPTFWANAAESARGLLDLEEAERLALESTRRGVSDYAQPFIDIADIRLRSGRIDETYQALLADRSYRRRRPPYLEQHGSASSGRTIAMMMILMNDPKAASELTRRAIVQPDRSGGKSRDIRQDLATSALLDFRARSDYAATLEDHADLLGGLRMLTRADALDERASAWGSSNRAASILQDNELLIGMIRIGGPYGVSLPPWLVPELIHATGPGIFLNAVERARELESFQPLTPYFDAFQADAYLALGMDTRAKQYAQKALQKLPENETLLRLRCDAILAKLSLDDDNIKDALPRLDRILALDPGLLRRLDIALPLKTPSDPQAEAVADLLLDTDRYTETNQGYTTVVTDSGSICLKSPNAGTSKCSKLKRPKDSSDEDYFVARVIQFHDTVLRPNTKLNAISLRSLNGSSTPSGGNRGLRNLLGTKEDTKPEKKP